VNATSDMGEICPVGYYCERGSYQATPCPAGTYSKDPAQGSSASCIQCPRDSFNDKPGQATCIPCGGSAVSRNDSLECQCKGANRVFQPFDSACRCMAGYTVYNGLGEAQTDAATSDGVTDCEAIVMPRCGPTEIRSPSGACASACPDTSCELPPCYCIKGIDICNNTCPIYQIPKAEKIQIDSTVGTALTCTCVCRNDSTPDQCIDPNEFPEQKTYEIIVDKAGNSVLKVITTSENRTYLLGIKVQTSSSDTAQAKFLSTSNEGFTGVLDIPTTYFDDLGLQECVMNPDQVCVEKQSLRSKGSSESKVQTMRRNRLRANTASSAVIGVQSPIMCLKAGAGVMWTIAGSLSDSSVHYPVYVSDSLLNTNPTFDYGAFVTLKDQVLRGNNVSTFFFQFDTPGIYVFRDSVEQSKQAVIGVVAPVLDCPKAFETNQIQPMSIDILKSFPTSEKETVINPDYKFITIVALSILIIFVVAVFLNVVRNQLGWGKSLTNRPKFRSHGSKQDYHSIATRKERLRVGMEVGSVKTIDASLESTELRGFSVSMLYDKLEDQNSLVSEQLTQQKQDIREFYEKVTRETATLRGLVDRNRNIGFTEDEIHKANDRKISILDEINRRKEIGLAGTALFEEAMKSAFSKVETINILQRLQDNLEKFNENYLSEIQQPEGNISKPILDELDDAVRQNIPALPNFQEFDEHGATLLSGSRQPFSKKDLFDSEGDLKIIPGVMEIDRATKLAKPMKGLEMMTGKGQIVPVPDNCCIHPISGKVIPMEGNVYFDPRRRCFNFLSCMDFKSLVAGPLPYICNRQNSKSLCYPDAAPYLHLISKKDRGFPLNESRTMLDPFTGLRVPVLGITSHVTTGEIHAVGGSMIDPVTCLLKPIRMGELMEDPDSKQVCMITGLMISEETGMVVPLGSRRTNEQGIVKHFIPGSDFVDIFSEESLVMGSTIANPLNIKRVIPSGSHELYGLRNAKLDLERDMLDRLSKLKGKIFAILPNDVKSLHNMGSKLMEVNRRMIEKTRIWSNFVIQQHVEMQTMAENGGKIGKKYDFVLAEELPLLIGCRYYDDTSRHEIVVLDVEVDEATQLFEGLGCTVIDPISGNIVPAVFGGRMKDPHSRNVIPVNAIKRDPSTFQVVPLSNLSSPSTAIETIGANDSFSLINELLKKLAENQTSSAALQSVMQKLQNKPSANNPQPYSDDEFEESEEESEQTDDADATSAHDADATSEPSSVSELDLEVLDPDQIYMRELRKKGQHILTILSQIICDDPEGLAKAVQELETYHYSKIEEFMQKMNKHFTEREEANRLVAESSGNEIAGQARSIQNEILHDVFESDKELVKELFARLHLENLEALVKSRKNEFLQDINGAQNVTTGERTKARIAKELENKLVHDSDILRNESLNQFWNFLEEAHDDFVSSLTDSKMSKEKLMETVKSHGDSINNFYDSIERDLEDQLEQLLMEKETAVSKKIALLDAHVHGRTGKVLWKKLKIVFQLTRLKGLKKHDIQQILPDESRLKEYEQALNEYSESKLQSFEEQLESEIQGKASQYDEEFLHKLERGEVEDPDTVKELLQNHESERQHLLERLQLDKMSQMEDLKRQLQERREKKMNKLKAEIHDKAAQQQGSGMTEEGSKLFQIQADLLIEQEIEIAKLESALTKQECSEISEVRNHHLLTFEAERATLKEANEGIQAAANDSERAKLISEHEIMLAKQTLMQNVARGKSEDDLRNRLSERRKKREQFLQLQHERQNEMVASGKESESIANEVNNFKKETALVLKHEQERANELRELLLHAQSEIEMLKDELKMQVKKQIEEKQRKIERDLSACSDQRREELLRQHSDDVERLRNMEQADAARQLANLEKNLQSKNAKKKKKMEQTHAKQMKELKTQLENEKIQHLTAEEISSSVQKEFEDKERIEAENISKKMEEQKKKVIAEANEEFMMKISNDLSEDEKQKLISQHEENLAKLSKYIDKENARRQEALQAQLMEKRRKKEERMMARKLQKEKQDDIVNKQRQELEQLEREQEKERQEQLKRLEEELQKEKDEELQKMLAEEANAAASVAEQDDARVQQSDMQISASVEDTEKEKLLEEAHNKESAIRNQASLDRQKQEQDLQQRLEKKKEKRMLELKRKQEAEIEQKLYEHVEEASKMLELNAAEQKAEKDAEVDEMVDAGLDLYVDKTVEDDFEKRLEEERQNLQNELEKMKEEQERMKREILEKQDLEMKKLEEEMQKDQEAFEQALMAEQQKKAEELKQKRQEMERELQMKADSATAEERDLLIQQHEEKMKMLEQEEAMKKLSTEEELKAKVAQRKEKKRKQQQKRANESLQLLLSEQKERESELKEVMRQKQVDDMLAMAKAGNVENAIHLMQQFHHTELEEEDVSFAEEYAKRMASAEDEKHSERLEQDLKTSREKRLEVLKSKHEKEMASIQNMKKRESDRDVLMKKLEVRAAEFKQMEDEFRARMEAEVARIEEENERLYQKELEDIKSKRGSESQRRSRGSSRSQTRESIQKEHEQESLSLSSALRDELQKQEIILKRKIEQRRQVRKAKFMKICTDLFNEIRDGKSLQSLSFDGLTSAEIESAKNILERGKRQYEQKKRMPGGKAAEKWMKKALNKRFSISLTPEDDVQQAVRRDAIDKSQEAAASAAPHFELYRPRDDEQFNNERSKLEEQERKAKAAKERADAIAKEVEELKSSQRQAIKGEPLNISEDDFMEMLRESNLTTKLLEVERLLRLLVEKNSKTKASS